MTVLPHANEPPAPLRVGCVVGSTPLREWIAAIDPCAELQLVACAATAEEQAADFMRRCDDPHQLISDGLVDALVLDGPLGQSLELAEAALERGLHVWRRPPLGRDFGEAVAVMRKQAGGRSVYQVASWWEAVRQEVAPVAERLADVYAAQIELRLSQPGPAPFELACLPDAVGGGVLMQQAYDLLEALQALRRLPETVSGAIGRLRRQGGQPLREVEDWAAALFRYSNGTSALVRASWDVAPTEFLLAFHGPAESLVLTREQTTLHSAVAEPVRQSMCGSLLRRQMQAFAQAIVDPRARERGPAILERHLSTSAVLEAIYLSARTSHIEAPRGFFEVQKWPEPRL